ncbi:hypothetical protein [uncultured Kordia sp.]|uniref:hypothetical protein n=1 Tax=uncultured Kordia sp. TaxID=507699 RepID=UPI0026055633|nr:hypothetical protein [uncultured Kordia sp.]
MKRKNLKVLRLEKTLVANLKEHTIKGGTMGSIDCPSYHPTVCDGGGSISSQGINCAVNCGTGTLPV